MRLLINAQGSGYLALGLPLLCLQLLVCFIFVLFLCMTAKCLAWLAMSTLAVLQFNDVCQSVHTLLWPLEWGLLAQFGCYQWRIFSCSLLVHFQIHC